MPLQKFLFFPLLVVFLASCSQTTSSNFSETTSNDWLVSEDEIVDGGPGRDGIPSIDQPIFAPANQVTYVQDDRLVIGIKIDNEIKVYPHQILDWHEVINDRSGETYFSLTYCPLTGTGIAWDRTVNGEVVEFGVSGLLYRNNLIPYDRSTNTNWSQMQMRGIQGALKGKHLHTYQVVQTTWKTLKMMYPDSRVLTTQTGYSRFYRGYAYGEDYLTDHSDILFPIKNQDKRLPNKTIVHAVFLSQGTNVNSNIQVFPVNSMGDSIQVNNVDTENNSFVTAGSAKYSFVVSFSRTLPNGTIFDFEAVQDNLPVIMSDQEGNKWTIFGEAVDGPRAGTRLNAVTSYNGYWFAIADFFPSSCIYPLTICKQIIDK
ncbi:DUF3179 domain-containing protein [Fodinibius sediminis]|uniref:DUF3179 domain-containing protein n=1 Tax=Fodinibius sediminis TaxID=1214077 RepID=A0A521CD92_9BACT|nr:DUF3179 domain-containing protein [Fodinibius sediminis]SMO56771.1 Protein of unknown function [Fodinibius sediminis]